MANRVVPDRYGSINIGKLKENLVTEVELTAMVTTVYGEEPTA